MTLMCECGHIWTNHRKIEGCLGDPDPNRPYEFKKLCECKRFRKDPNAPKPVTPRQDGQR